MDVSINWLAVLLAGLSSLVTGSIFYSKAVFGKLWIKLAKLDEKRIAKNWARPIIIALLMSFLAAFVIAHVATIGKEFFGGSELSAGLSAAFWLWLGISVTTVLTHDGFEGRPSLLSFLTISYQFFALMVMGLIIGLLGGF